MNQLDWNRDSLIRQQLSISLLFVRDKNHVAAPSKALMFKNPTM